MKLYYVLFLLVVGGFIFMITAQDKGPRQAQEEAPMVEQITRNTFRIRVDITGPEKDSVADILWFQKAAELAIDKKIPWFNVLDQTMSKTAVEGVIQLERDPMKAEYDANEILSLQLSEGFED
jgi:predicted P-loop ATPase/GTPase